MSSSEQLLEAYEKARYDLLAERSPDGHWIGELSTSALSTATAVSALALVRRHEAAACPLTSAADLARDRQLQELILRGLRWLCDHQNPDGGWGDTDKSYSNIATTMLALAAFHLTGIPADHAEMIERAREYVARQGGIAGLRRRYGRDKTFAVPILTNCALAGMISWNEVAALPFELACLPQSWYRFVRLPVVSYAIPALVAIGQVRFFQKPPLNPITRWIRSRSVAKSLKTLENMQPASGGYLEAVPLASFVVMGLAGSGRTCHPVVKRGVEFLIQSVRPDGSWPIDTNLATWNTTLAMNSLAGAGEDVTSLESLDWLLACQHAKKHPFTGADPGGWAWTDLSGGVPDSDDTPGALLALDAWSRSPDCHERDRRRIGDSAELGIQWLLGLQNSNGGWPTFCRGWGMLPFDRSGADLTAHAIRALSAWTHDFADDQRIAVAIERGFTYLAREQKRDGRWIPLWFGNQDDPEEQNPVYGTAKVLLCYRDAHRLDRPEAIKAIHWLVSAQNADGGWGGGFAATDTKKTVRRSSTEETALAVEALLSSPENERALAAAKKGTDWLCRAVEQERHRECSPIGFYFAKLWYYERLYPLTFTVSALGQAVRTLLPRSESKPAPAHVKQI